MTATPIATQILNGLQADGYAAYVSSVIRLGDRLYEITLFEMPYAELNEFIDFYIDRHHHYDVISSETVGLTSKVVITYYP